MKAVQLIRNKPYARHCLAFVFFTLLCSFTLSVAAKTVAPKTQNDPLENKLPKGISPRKNTSAHSSEYFPGGETSVRTAKNKHAFSQPSANLSLEERLGFAMGKAIFEKLWVSSPSSTTASDGLGPLYNARSCARCHVNNGRGEAPPLDQDTKALRPISLFVRLSIPPNPLQQTLITSGAIDFVAEPTYGAQLQGFANPGGRTEGRLKVSYLPKIQTLSEGDSISLYAPIYEITNLGYGPMHPDTMVSPRLAPPMIGLGLLENISSRDIQDLADPEDSNNDGISGRIRWVKNRQTDSLEIGRFGWKAGSPTLDQQNAAALFHDIGIGSSLFIEPWGDCTAKQDACRSQPHGNTGRHDNLEASQKMTKVLADYTRHLAIPVREEHTKFQAGKEIFHQVGCASCHRPSFTTRADANHPALAEQIIWPYSDLLLHDMGEGLADNRPEGNANGREWRTPPLWGIGFTPYLANNQQEKNRKPQYQQNTNGAEYYLHDGRARSLIEAILWHGGEGLAAANKVRQLSSRHREQLILFLESL